MESKKLVKVIKALVEVEVKKQQLNFLQNQFPKILEEAVQSRIKSKPQKKATEVDPFTLVSTEVTSLTIGWICIVIKLFSPTWGVTSRAMPEKKDSKSSDSTGFTVPPAADK